MERIVKHNLLIRKTGRKFIRMLLLLITVSIVTFTLVSMSPIDPLQANVGQAALGAMSQEQKAKLEEYWGVNVPPVRRYLNWAGGFVRGDMGISLLYRQPVSQVIGVKLSNSLFLMVFAWLISGILGLVLGILAGVFRGTWADRIIKGYSLLISSTPVFWLALLLLLVFAVWLKVLPIAECSYRRGERRRHLSGPAAACHTSGGYSQHHRSGGGDSSYERKND
mgnify:CR=1 FL=1